MAAKAGNGPNLEEKQLSLELPPIRDASAIGESFAYYSTVLAPPLQF